MRKTIVLIAAAAVILATWLLGGVRADATLCIYDQRGSSICTPKDIDIPPIGIRIGRAG